ncbi:hypothetical protein [Ruminococcus sp.]|uniref:hypothetical protein n=1 Tax=Ruminococcus sp. TaxID=41978 RepID=UPI00258C5841|nr:hypothetical protein [Ruminococcus sp.]MCR5020603.1 hypothetical protein [Ruminococcus sp.]
MKEKYVRVFPESGDENIFSCASGLILFVWTLFATVSGLGTFLALLPLILFIIILETSMASFTADDHAVTFRYLLKKTVIPYETINGIDIEAEYRETNGLGIHRYYAEVITFHCADDKDYTFAGKLEKPVDVILEHPCYLQRIPGNSKFSQLKRYIDNKINTDQGGKPNV